MFHLIVNGRQYQVDVSSDTPLLWVLREHLGLLGTKYSCGEGLCGCCTVHLEGEPVPSCTTPIDVVDGRCITTIEGIAGHGSHPLIRAWLEENVSQCGFCQPGQIMTAAALLARIPVMMKSFRLWTAISADAEPINASGTLSIVHPGY